MFDLKISRYDLDIQRTSVFWSQRVPQSFWNLIFKLYVTVRAFVIIFLLKNCYIRLDFRRHVGSMSIV